MYIFIIQTYIKAIIIRWVKKENIEMPEPKCGEIHILYVYVVYITLLIVGYGCALNYVFFNIITFMLVLIS